MEKAENNNSMYDNLSDKGKMIILEGVLTGIENKISYLNQQIKNIQLSNSELKGVYKEAEDMLSICQEEVINELKQALIHCNSCLNEESINNNENYELLETIKQIKQYNPKFTCDLNEDCDWILETAKLFGIQFIAKNYIYCNEIKFFYQNNLLSTLEEILKINSLFLWQLNIGLDGHDMEFINNDLINELGIDVFANLTSKQFENLWGTFMSGLNETYIKLLKINPKMNNISYSCMGNDAVTIFGYEFLANMGSKVDFIISLFKGLEKDYYYKFSMQELKTLITNNQDSAFNIDNYMSNFYYLSEENKKELLGNSQSVNELAEKLGIFSKGKKINAKNLYNNPDDSSTTHKLLRKFLPRKK